MKKNSKIALMLVGASLLGSATTLVGESALRSAGYDVDTYIPNKESASMDDSFVRTASSRSAAMSSGVDFTVVAENTINSVGRLAQDGMRDTDREILEIMIQ